MPALKLFISHSSRLDDVAHRHPDDDANWRLLREVCARLRVLPDVPIRLLMDRDDDGGLLPSDDWTRQLNLWLAECHAAVMLVTRRALERSDWVAKEAAILGWRWALDPEFRLLLIPIEDECTCADLKSSFFGALDLDRVQSETLPRDAGRIAERIRDGLGDIEALAARATPLYLLQGMVAKLLAQAGTQDALEAAADALDCAVQTPRATRAEAVAAALARRLLLASADEPALCFGAFSEILRHLHLGFPREQAMQIFKQVRALWVHPGAASYLPLGLQDQRTLALCGQLLFLSDQDLDTESYTLERYLQRAWRGEPPICVPVSRWESLEDVRREIRRQVFKKHLPPMFPPEEQDAMVNKRQRDILVVLTTAPETGGWPDRRLLDELATLPAIYRRLGVVVACADAGEPSLYGLRQAEPPLVPATERAAYMAERMAHADLQDYYRGCD
jgi:hypothetical protein